MPRIRGAEPFDAARIAAIYIESWNSGFGHLLGYRDLDDEQAARWRATISTAPDTWWVAERDGDVVGFVGIGPSRDPIDEALGELDTIAVAPAHWRTGVGRALMDVALHALRAGYPEAILWTVADYDRGQRFYEALGWRATGDTRADGREVSFRRTL